MITKDLIDYIKKAQGLGADRDGIERLLIENDWDYEDITEAFIAIENEKHGSPIKFKEADFLTKENNGSAINDSSLVSPNLVYQNKSDNYQEPIAEKKPEENQSLENKDSNSFNQGISQSKTDFNNPKIMGIPSEFKVSSEKIKKEQTFFDDHNFPKKKNGVKILFLVFLIILIIGGTGFYSYTKGYLKIPFLDKILEKEQSIAEPVIEKNPDQQFIYSDLEKINQIISFGIPNSIINENISFNFSDQNNPLAVFIKNSLKANGYLEENYVSLDKYDLKIKGAKDHVNNLAEGNLQFKNGSLSLDFSFRKNKEQLFLSNLSLPKEIFVEGNDLSTMNYIVSESEIKDIFDFLGVNVLSEVFSSLSLIDLNGLKDAIPAFSRPELFSISSSLGPEGQYRTVVFDNIGGASVFGQDNISQVTIVYDLSAIERGDFPFESIETSRNIIENNLIVKTKQVFEKTDNSILITEPISEEINTFELATIIRLKKEQIKKNNLLNNLSLIRDSALEYKKQYGGFSAFCNMESIIKAITLIGDESGFLVQCSDAKDGFVVYSQTSNDTIVCVDEKKQGEFNITPSGLVCSSQ